MPCTPRRRRSVPFFAGTAAVLAALGSACVHSEVPVSEEPRQPAIERPVAPPAPAETAPPPARTVRTEVQRGYATWYGRALAGRRTANGERFDPSKMTAAHRTLPLGTWVEVRRIDASVSVRVRITDRGPFGHEDRIIDLSRAAADKLGIRKAGVAMVEVRVVEGP